jgi:plasmid stabilization system protein ParE
LAFKTYQIIYPQTILDKLDEIYDYTVEMYYSDRSAKKIVDKIMTEIDRLKTSPMIGFNADDKLGLQIVPPFNTRGIIAGDYLIFYHVQENFVVLTHLVAARSDYIKLFRK